VITTSGRGGGGLSRAVAENKLPEVRRSGCPSSLSSIWGCPAWGRGLGVSSTSPFSVDSAVKPSDTAIKPPWGSALNSTEARICVHKGGGLPCRVHSVWLLPWPRDGCLLRLSVSTCGFARGDVCVCVCVCLCVCAHAHALASVQAPVCLSSAHITRASGDARAHLSVTTSVHRVCKPNARSYLMQSLWMQSNGCRF
jgi:hypothetical protein